MNRSLSVSVNWSSWRLVLAIVALVGLGYGGLTLRQPTASTVVERALTQNVGATDRLSVDVVANGTIAVDGRVIKQTVRRTLDSDEVRFALIDSAATFTDSLTVHVQLPAAARSQADFMVYAIHGAELADLTLTPDRTAATFSVRNLDVGASVSLAVKLPRGAVGLGPRAFINSLTSMINPLWWWIVGAAIVITTYGSLTVKIRRSLSHATDQGVITAPPSNLTPAAAGLLVTGQAGPAQIAATLLTMAKNGDIQLVQTSAGYRIAKRRNLTDLSELDSLLIDELRLKIGPISNQDKIKENLHRKLFSRHMTQAFESITHELEIRGFFANTHRQTLGYRFWGALLIVSSLVTALAAPALIPDGVVLLPSVIGVFSAGWIILVIAPHLPRLTSVGQSERSRWLAFVAYLSEPVPFTSRAEADRLFMAYLPYAISCGATKPWVKRFSTTVITIPDWYFNEENAGSPQLFIDDMSQIVTDISRTLSVAALPQN